ncbi:MULTISPECIES: head-tail adaptor protein [Rhizobium]|uniref:Phage head-tail adaptor, putative n=1 Tax=Rhizobium favelukesii TaxID=348824 RepID=W6RC62_9HYPH|nr:MULTISPECIES: head-tail adaptor protein [Rhizobium]MCS0462993.1 head-tail adaptor protein [Rhizobium favelukesii]UFS82045.1 head-tail adaptor protein [Rhizobium sp. T136]CDM56283.1 phage head-tail adaptor, putative [Rhizobium favelukesii]
MAPSKPTSGELQHRVAFDERTTVDDGYGNTEGGFAERFKSWAAFRPRGGSEAVVAARLEGRNILGVYLRSTAQTTQIKADWRMRDVRTGDVYAIRIVDAVSDRYWVYVEVQTGVAA